SASADYYGGYRWPATGVGYPKTCLVAAVNILTSPMPNKHNAAAANSCATDISVKVHLEIWEANSPDRLLDAKDAGPSTNYAQARLADVTGSGDYWVWVVYIKSGTTYVGYLCSNKGFAYSGCFMSSD